MAAPNSVTTIHPSNLATNQAIRLLAVAIGVNVNATGDQATLQINNSTNYSVSNVVFTNASVSLTTAAAGLFTAPSAGGTAIVSNAALTALTGSTVVSQRTVASTATQSAQNLYLNVGTAQGATATMDVYVYGYDFSNYS
jgi:hypothetical protein